MQAKTLVPFALCLVAACGGGKTATDALKHADRPLADSSARDSGTPDFLVGDSMVPADYAFGEGHCPEMWSVEDNAMGFTASATISSGLILSEKGASQPDGGGGMLCSGPGPCEVLLVYQAGASGDFDATADFSGFVPGGDGAEAGIFVADEADFANTALTSIVQAGSGSSATMNLEGVIGSEESAMGYRGVSSTGTLEVARSGTNLTVTITVGGQKATMTRPFSPNAVDIGLYMNAYQDDVGGPGTSVTFDRFSITGGGGHVKSDSFACDSLMM